LASQVFSLFCGESDHEVRRKPVRVSFDGTIKRAGLDAVKLGEVVVEHNPEIAEQKMRFSAWSARASGFIRISLILVLL
jgi:hypothetical protein